MVERVQLKTIISVSLIVGTYRVFNLTGLEKSEISRLKSYNALSKHDTLVSLAAR